MILQHPTKGDALVIVGNEEFSMPFSYNPIDDIFIEAGISFCKVADGGFGWTGPLITPLRKYIHH